MSTKQSKVDKQQETLHVTSEIYSLLTELHQKTVKLYQDINESQLKPTPGVILGLSEVFSLYSTSKMFLSIHYNYSHYEITSLISYFEKTYDEMECIAKDSDSIDHSQLISEFENFSDQFNDFIKPMFEQRISETIKYIKELTAN